MALIYTLLLDPYLKRNANGRESSKNLVWLPIAINPERALEFLPPTFRNGKLPKGPSFSSVKNL